MRRDPHHLPTPWRIRPAEAPVLEHDHTAVFRLDDSGDVHQEILVNAPPGKIRGAEGAPHFAVHRALGEIEVLLFAARRSFDVEVPTLWGEKAHRVKRLERHWIPSRARSLDEPTHE